LDNPIQRFQEYKQNTPDWRRHLGLERWGSRQNPRFERIRVQLNRTVDSETVTDTYCPVIDTRTGEVYLDSSPEKIAAKHLIFAFLHPIYSTLKTLYHLSIILPLIVNGWSARQARKEGKESHFWRDMGRSMADIIRTPGYGLAITATHLIGVGAAIFEPDSLYKTQALAGYLAGRLMRERIAYKTPIFEGCMAPIKDVMQIGKANRIWDREIVQALDGKPRLAHLRASAISYLSTAATTSEARKQRGLDFFAAIEALETEEEKQAAQPAWEILTRNGLRRFAQNQVHFQQTKRALFNRCGRRLPSTQPYRTPGTPERAARPTPERQEVRFGTIYRDSRRFQRARFESEAHAIYWTIDTENGDVYLDCRRRKLFAKQLTLTLLRPIHTTIKTLYHATIVLPLIANTVDATRHRSGSQFMRDNWNSLVDIFRTPVYGLLLTGVHLVGVVAAIYPNSLYYTRKTAGKLERDLLRTSFPWHSSWVLSPWLTPMANYWHSQKKGIHTLTERRIEVMQERCGLFNGCRRLGKEEVYITPGMPEN